MAPAVGFPQAAFWVGPRKAPVIPSLTNLCNQVKIETEQWEIKDDSSEWIQGESYMKWRDPVSYVCFTCGDHGCSIMRALS